MTIRLYKKYKKNQKNNEKKIDSIHRKTFFPVNYQTLRVDTNSHDEMPSLNLSNKDKLENFPASQQKNVEYHKNFDDEKRGLIEERKEFSKKFDEYCDYPKDFGEKKCGLCNFCLERKNGMLEFKCRHSFHKECASDWNIFDQNDNCPMCKENYSED